MSNAYPHVQTPPAAGWYPEPQSAGFERYWDGVAWSELVRPVAGPLMTAAPSYAPAAPAKASNTLSIIAIVLGAVALLFLPVPLGVAGIILGLIAKSKGQSLATWAIVVPLIGMIVGMGLGILVGAAMA